MATRIRSIERNSVFAWSSNAQHGNLLACATRPGTFDMEFNVKNQIEIFNTADLSKPFCAVETAQGFSALAWNSQNILAGAGGDGNVYLYDPAQFGKAEPKIAATHSGCKTVDFSPLQPNMLASGGADGDIIVVDANTVGSDSPKTQTFNPATRGGAVMAGIDCSVTSIAWNRKIPPIFAAVSANGQINVFDLRNKKGLILSFGDQGRRAPWTSCCWDPNEPTVLCTACAAEEKGVVLWDLRSVQLARYFSGHTKGVNSVSWCSPFAQGSTAIMSAGYDKTLIWNPNTLEVLCEVPHVTRGPASPVKTSDFGVSTDRWDICAMWAPHSYGTFATATIGAGSGSISIGTIQDIAKPEHFNPAADYTNPPVALRRPISFDFGFGGRMAVFKNGELHVHQLDANKEISDRATAFQTSLKETNATELCGKKAADCQSELNVWKGVEIRQSSNSKDNLLVALGYSKEKIEEELAPLLKKEEEEEAKEEEAPAAEEKKEDEVAEKKEEGDVFEQIAENGMKDEESSDDDETDDESSDDETDVEEEEEEDIPPVEVDLEGDNGLLARALVVGKLEAAVDLCIAKGRIADALCIASYGDKELFERVRNNYIRKNWMGVPTLAFMRLILNGKLEDIIEKVAVSSWRAALACVAHYAPVRSFPILCSAIADKLKKAGMIEEALFCYSICGRVDKIAAIWKDAFDKSTEPRHVALAQFVEDTTLLTSVYGCKNELDEAYIKLFVEYAGLVSDQGAVGPAADYLSFFGREKLEALPERLFYYRVMLAGGSLSQVDRDAIETAMRGGAPKAQPAQRHVTSASTIKQVLNIQPKPQPAAPVVAKPLEPAPAARASAAATHVATPTMMKPKTSFVPMMPTPQSPAAAQPAQPHMPVAGRLPVPMMPTPQSPAAPKPAQPLVPTPAASSSVQMNPLTGLPRTGNAAPVPASSGPSLTGPSPVHKGAHSAASTPMKAPAMNAHMFMPTAPAANSTPAAAPAPVMAAPVHASAPLALNIPQTSRPAPERITQPLANIVGHAVADADMSKHVMEDLALVLRNLSEGTEDPSDHAHINEAEGKVALVRFHMKELQMETVQKVQEVIDCIKAKNYNTADRQIIALLRLNDGALSSDVVTGLRMMARLARKILP